MKNIVVGMSGGVDSSVAALLLKQQGYEVIGLSMRLFTCGRVQEGSCCTEADRRDARAVCDALGIKHATCDLTPQFRRTVIEPFIDSYLKGETPSPCIRCNEHLKFDAFIDEAARLGADLIATGHYARVLTADDGTPILKAGSDRAKDQSYFLFPALKGALPRLRFPVGDLTKDEVRAIAKEHGLPVHDKDESQEVCFVPDNDYAAFIEEMRPGALPGRGCFVDARGRELGRHRGIHAYTVGQRRGLGIGFGRRTYVVSIDASANEVVLGDDADLMKREATMRDVVWAPGASGTRRATVRIRSTHEGAPASLEMIDEGCVRIAFDDPQRAIAPGQAAVFYDDDTVIGGGWIAS